MRKLCWMAAIITATVGVTMAVTPAMAHPHVWVTSKSRIVYDKDAVTAIEQSWIFDEYYSAMAVQGLDKNNDGQYSREELAELAKINMDGLKEFEFFTFAKAGQSAVPIAEPTNAHLDFTGGILSLHFTVPMKAPTPAKDLKIATYDPSFFIAFELAKDEGVTLAGAPATCAIAMVDDDAASPAGAATPPGAQNDTLTGALTEQFGGAAVVGTKWARIDCKSS